MVTFGCSTIIQVLVVEQFGWLTNRWDGLDAPRLAPEGLRSSVRRSSIIWSASPSWSRRTSASRPSCVPRTGLAFVAIHDNETVAAAAGVSVVRYRLLAMTAGGYIAGLAGAINGHTLTRHISPGSSGSRTRSGRCSTRSPAASERRGPDPRTLVVRVFWEWSIRHVGGFDSLILIGLSLALVVTALPRGVYPVSRAPSPRSACACGRARRGGRELLEVRRLSKHFGGLQALSDVDFEIAPGEIVGLIGPNGAGKSTLINAITGVHPPDAGTIRLRRRDLAGLPPDRITRLGIGRTFQIPQPSAASPVSTTSPSPRSSAAVSPASRLRRTRHARPSMSSARRQGAGVAAEPHDRGAPTPRAGARARDRRAAAAPRRDQHGADPVGDRAGDPADPACPRPRRHDPDGRAPRAAHHERVRPDRRARLRPQDRRGGAGRDRRNPEVIRAYLGRQRGGSDAHG